MHERISELALRLRHNGDDNLADCLICDAQTYVCPTCGLPDSDPYCAILISDDNQYRLVFYCPNCMMIPQNENKETPESFTNKELIGFTKLECKV